MLATRPKFEDQVPAIKAYFSVKEEFSRLHSDAVRRNGRTVVCPYCEDKSGSAVIDDNGYRCFQCHVSYNSIIDFRMYEFKESMPEAIESLKKIMGGGVVNITPAIHTVPKPKPIKKAQEVTFTQSDIFPYCRRVDLAMSYFRTRGISELTVYRTKLGYSEPMTTKPYEYADGTVEWLKAPRYTIPYLQGNTILSINMRLDEEWSLDYINNPDNAALVQKIRADYAAQNNLSLINVDDKKLIKAMFGPKYWRKGGYHVYNQCRAINGLTSLVIVEGEFDAIAVEEVGIPCIAAKHFSAGLQEVAKNARHVIVIADNDADRLDKTTGLMVNDARNNAMKIVNKVNGICPGLAHMVIPPAGYKDANAMHKDGILKTWLQNAGASQTVNKSSKRIRKLVII
jgi:nucleoside-triphosphatase THEP1